MAMLLLAGTVFIVVFVAIYLTAYDEFCSRYRLWHVLNIEKLAASKWACRLVAEALEIDADAGEPAEYVQYALRERIKQEGRSDG